MILESLIALGIYGVSAAVTSLGVATATFKLKKYREQFLIPAEEDLARVEAGLIDGPDGDAESALVDQPDHTPDKPHRRIRLRDRFISATAVEIKNEMGCPTRSAANLLVVRKKAHDIMKARGVRPSHACRVIDAIVALVFVPSGNEIIYERSYHSIEWRRRRRLFETAVKPPSLVSWLLAGDQRYWEGA
jgi:hypothetical protein